MKMVEAQMEHRHKQEALIVKSQTGLAARGQWIGTGLCAFFGLIGWHLAATGHDAPAGILFGTTIVGVVTVFVIGRISRKGRDSGESTEE